MCTALKALPNSKKNLEKSHLCDFSIKTFVIDLRKKNKRV